MPRKIIDQNSDAADKVLISCYIDPQVKFWLARLAQMEESAGNNADSISRQIRTALHMYLRHRLPHHYRESAEEFRQSNERTGKIYNNERW